MQLQREVQGKYNSFIFKFLEFIHAFVHLKIDFKIKGKHVCEIKKTEGLMKQHMAGLRAPGAPELPVTALTTPAT